jgi:PKD repeat protein
MSFGYLVGMVFFFAHGDNVGHTYRKAGTCTVTLQVQDARGRKATAREQILVRPNVAPEARFTVSADDVVVGDTVTADASGSRDPDGQIVKYEWDLDGDGHWSEDGVRHSLGYDTAGDYYAGLRVTDNDGNVSETHVAIHVGELPDPQSRIVCEKTTVAVREALRCSADDSGSPVRVVRHEWDLDDDGSADSRGSGVRWVYRKAGDYTIHLTVTDKRGRTSTTTQDVHVTNRPPSATVSGPTRLAVGQSGQYDASRSSDSDGWITGYAWSLAEAEGASQALPGSGRYLRFTPTRPGTYVLAVAVSDDAGDSSQATVTVTVTGQPPVAKITLPADPFVTGREAQLDGSLSTSAYGSIATYEWDLNGDGEYETAGATPTVTPAGSGNAVLRLRVTDEFGATATAEVTVRVHAPPQPSLTAPTTATTNQAATFSSSGSRDPDGRIVSYSWDFDGDGVVDRTTTTRGSISWTFANAGSFLVTLTATDDEGLKTTATATVQVLTPTVAYAGAV